MISSLHHSCEIQRIDLLSRMKTNIRIVRFIVVFIQGIPIKMSDDNAS